MHYVMEQVNGTLTEWDKTHDIKTYTNLNQGRTAVSFTYYPQFWLPVNQRPVFDKALYDLIKQLSTKRHANCKKTTCKGFNETFVVNKSDVNQTKSFLGYRPIGR